jgi:HK97 family phage prohead protease
MEEEMDRSQSAREIRSIKAVELRTETDAEGNVFLSGYAANYNVLSVTLADRKGKFRERLMPGAFARVISEHQDVRHLVNHNPNSVLGRTKAGTTELTEDEKGLRFRTMLPNTTIGRDIAELVKRGDIDECSFGFKAVKDAWIREKSEEVREIYDLDLHDISTVTYPAYPGTISEISARAEFPDGLPTEIRSRVGLTADEAREAERMEGPPADEPAPGPTPEPEPAVTLNANCECTCDECENGDCMDCTNEDCTDPNCDANRSIRIGETRALNVVSAGADRPEQIKMQAEVNAAGDLELLVYDDIGENFWTGGGVTAKMVRQAIDAAGEFNGIVVRINSPGGDAFEGVAIFNVLRAHKKPVTTYVDGLAASAASVIAMAGDKRIMGVNTMMMIHNASSIVYGDHNEMRQMADVLEKISDSIGMTYVARSGKTAEEVKALMDAESWMSAQDCMDNGFCTGVETLEPAVEEKSLPHNAEQWIDRMVATYKAVPANVVKRLETRAAAEREKINTRRRVAAASI